MYHWECDYRRDMIIGAKRFQKLQNSPIPSNGECIVNIKGIFLVIFILLLFNDLNLLLLHISIATLASLCIPDFKLGKMLFLEKWRRDHIHYPILQQNHLDDLYFIFLLLGNDVAETQYQWIDDHMVIHLFQEE